MALSNINSINSYAFGQVQGYVEPTIYEKENIAYDVITFGRRNTYPQEVEFAVSRSSITKACVQTFAEFLYGDGFENELTANAVVNDKGQTANEVLWEVCRQFAMFKGFALFDNCNLAGQYTSIEAFPFTYVRLGIEDEDGYLKHARIWDNWAGESPRAYSNVGDIYTIKLFNPQKIQEQIAECGGIENYNGQLLYYTDNAGYYPECSFDSAFEQALANGNIPEFTNNYIRNGFSNSAIIVNETVGLLAEEKAQRMADLKALSGLRNAGKIGYVEGNFNLLDISSTQQLDKQYVEINEKIKDDIREVFQIPSVLLGSTRQGGFPNQDEMSDAYTYYNSKTRMYRHMISKQFAEIANNFVYDIGSNFAIKETSFLDVNIEESEKAWSVLKADEQRKYIAEKYSISLIEDTPKTKENGKASADNESDNPDQAKAQAQLRGSVGGVQGILSIAENFKNGIINEKSATTILEEIYGFSNIIAREILGL